MNTEFQEFHPEEYSSLELIARQVVEGFITGLHKSPFHGFSVEFAEHRLYNSGESTKHIDWKLYGRTDKLFVKRYEEETNLRCQIVLDASSSMYYPEQRKPSLAHPTKFLFGVYAASALIYLLKKQRDAFGLSLFAEELEVHTPCKSSSVHQQYIYQLLHSYLFSEKGKEKRKTSAATILHQIAESVHKRSLIIIFSDMMDNMNNREELFGALQHLKHNKHEVILFHTYDKSTEVDFNFENRPYRFVDLESEREVKINPIELKEQYQKSMKEFKKELHLKCSQYHIDLIEANITGGFQQILTPYLLKRSRLY